MITPKEFPYIKSLYVNNCYAYKDVPIELHDYKPFSHLILTGKNGSGKSTILRAIDNHLLQWRGQNNKKIEFADPNQQIAQYIEIINFRLAAYGVDDPDIISYKSALDELRKVIISFGGNGGTVLRDNSIQTLYSFLKAKRESKVKSVDTVTRDDSFIDQLLKKDSTDIFATQFKQYLVNKKVAQAFDQLNGQQERISENKAF
jgi:guanylate kinase